MEERKPKKTSPRRGGGRLKTKPSKDSKEEYSEPLQPQPEDHLNRSPTVATASDRGSNASHRQQQPSKSGGIVSPRVHQDSNRRTSGTGPVDLDETDMGVSDENREKGNLSPRLSFHQLQQFNRQSGPTATQSHNAAHHLYVHSAANVLDNSMESASDAESSDFNLSTDAEDTEYNNLRRRGGDPYLNASNLDTSAISQMSSPTNYTTDDDNAIFPALQTDDDATATQDDSLAAPDDEAQAMTIMPMAHETEDDMRAWTLSPSSQPSTKSDSNKPSSPKFKSGSYNNNKSTSNNKTPKLVEVAEQAPTDAFARDAFGKDAFGNFANFDDVFPMEQAKQQPRTTTNARRDFLIEAPEARKASSSASAAPQQETSLSDLLAQAKRKSSRNSSSKRGSLSVNSAPVITSEYLRKTHHLGRSSRDGDSRSVDKTTSVSDIIQSLEATNASRIKPSRSGSRSYRSSSDAHSHASNGGTSTRSAKSRLRENRRKERERLGGSDESDNEEGGSESWLFDEVAGTLGPRGVAADMESLGGRSNRSKNSGGGKSHRSHRSHKSHRSHRSSRRKKSSSESVDSRNSRNSRYSHRSTRSYLSQMSEQSRSVANDLLRLEMQLAMVGSQEVNGEDKGASGSVTGSTGGASRASRASRTSRNRSSARTNSVSKRSKMTVIAPPGKLGIILANKADSKGTVVSGVRTSSVLAEKISPGDRIIAIDGEDVSLMTVSEITTIMARKNDFERQLTIMTTPKHLGLTSQSRGDYAEADGYYRR